MRHVWEQYQKDYTSENIYKAEKDIYTFNEKSFRSFDQNPFRGLNFRYILKGPLLRQIFTSRIFLLI